MPKYEVQVSVNMNPLRITYVVEADSEEEAREIAEERGMDFDLYEHGANIEANFVDVDNCKLIRKPRAAKP